ncbi:prepilin peptidase, partial [Acidiphilium sp. PM]
MTVQGNILVAGTILASPFIGSFIGTLVEDLPRGLLLARRRSRCDACATPLGAADLVPLASYLLRRGRCAHCGAAIPRRLLLIELATLLLAVVIAVLDPAGPRVPLDFAFAATLLAAALIDLDCLRLPDALTLPLLLAGLVVTALRQPEALPAHAA